MELLAGTFYDPAVAVAKTTAVNREMIAFDTTNLRLVFTARSQFVLVKLGASLNGATTMPQVLLGILDGSTVKGRQVPLGALPGTALATTNVPIRAEFLVATVSGTGYTWDAAYGVETAVASTNINYGGPNTSGSANNAWGGFQYEIWNPIPNPTNFGLTRIGSDGVVQSNVVQISGAAINPTIAQIGANIVQISSDSGAADNLESFYDGVGYSGPNNFIGSVGNVTGTVASVVSKIGYSLSSPQTFDLIGNITGTLIGNIQGYVGTVTGSVGSVLGLTPQFLDIHVSSRIPSGTVVVGTNNDKSGYSLSSPQNFHWIGNHSGTWVGLHQGDTVGNTTGTWMGNISGTVGAVNGLVPSRLDVPVSSRIATGTMVNANLKQIDEQATNGNNATLYLKQINILNTAGDGIDIITQGGRGILVDAQDYPALELKSSADISVLIESIDNYGVEIVSGDIGLLIQSDTQDAIKAHALGGNGNGINLIGAGTGKSLNASQGIFGNIVGNITGTLVGDVTGTSGIRTGTFIDAIADQVWDEQIGNHLLTGSTGKKLSDAASAGDPWGTNLPASYTPGQAGYILGTNLNDTVSSRMPSGTIPTASQIATEVLNQASSNPIDSNVKQVNDVDLQGDGSTTPWGPA